MSYEQDGPVLVITLNQPEALNALTPPMEGELHAALEQGDRDESIRSIILTGLAGDFLRVITFRKIALKKGMLLPMKKK